jgi:CPA1 family monovalent cation:H+ antiporter
MNAFSLFALLITMAALFSYINHRFLKLPTAIGLMALTLVGSMLLIAGNVVFPGIAAQAARIVSSIDLNTAFLKGMLGFMLFAGALHVDFTKLVTVRWPVLLFSTVGVMTSTVLVGTLTWVACTTLGIPARFIYCLLFGSLISPTDPIAVMSILRQAGIPKELEMKIAGESLFNDGVAVVIFIALLRVAIGGGELSTFDLTVDFLWEAGGGILLGAIAGYIVLSMLRRVDQYQVEVLLTVSLVAGSYALANAIHISGPLSVVVSGLLIGTAGRSSAMSENTRERVDTFWELIDEILNAILFVLIGLEVLVISFAPQHCILGLLAIPITLAARFVAVWLPSLLLKGRYSFSRNSLPLLTWGGLRGGISVALALAIPMQTQGALNSEREVILVLTYVVVVFSILVQGLTLGPLAARWGRGPMHS